MKPGIGEYPPYYENYIRNVKQEEVLGGLLEAKKEALALIKSIPASLEEHAYAEGKWTIKQVLLHCVDTERVFSYRAMCFARGELQMLPSFDENVYADNSHASLRSLSGIAAELDAVGTSTALLFGSFPATVLETSGQMAAGKITINALGYTIAGHLLHHLGVLRERYLK